MSRPSARKSSVIDEVNPPQGQRAPATAVWVAVRESLLVVTVALVVSIFVKTFLLQAFYIPSGSMEQTLDIGDRVIVSKLTPGPFMLHRGDVVVFSDPGGWLHEASPARRGQVATAVGNALTFVGLLPEGSDDHLIKRVIGLPGDHVMSDGKGPIMVNGTPIDESVYLALGEQPSLGEPFDVVVPTDRLWVMGDNRSHSCDSRCNVEKPSKGFVPIDLVTGRALAVVWPVRHWTWLGTPSNFDVDRGDPGVS